MITGENRNKLNSIIDRMKANGESEDSIREMVGQFKSKYDVSPDVPISLGQAMTPRTWEAEQKGKSTVLPQILDALSMSGRAILGFPTLWGTASALGAKEGWKEYKKELANYKGGNIIEKTIKDPATAVTLPIGGPVLGGVKGLAVSAVRGLAQGGLSGITHQAEKIGAGEKVSPKEAIAETGMGLGLGIGGQVLPKIAKLINKTAGGVSRGLTGVKEEALRAAGTKAGREALKSNFKQEYAIGQEVVDRLKNSYTTIKEGSEKVIKALSGVGEIDIKNMVNNLDNFIKEPVTKEAKAAAKSIIEKADELSQLATTTGKTSPTSVPAEKLYNFRKEIDDIIDVSFGESTGPYIRALKQLRTDIKNELLKTAKGTEYEEGMKELAQKLDAVDKMKTMLGKNVTTQEGRAENFVKNINNAGKTQQREWLNNFESIFGGEAAKQSKYAQLARQFGEESGGVPGWMPQHSTGKSLLGIGIANALGTPLLGVPLSSPKIASRIVLPTTEAGEKAALWASKEPGLRLLGRGIGQTVRNIYSSRNQ